MKASIFDMDGVLVDNNAYHKRAWLEFLRGHGHHLTDSQLNLHVYGKTNQDILEYVFGDGLDQARIQELSYQKEEIYRQIFAGNISAPPGLRSLLKTLYRTVPIGVATSAPPQNLDFVIDSLQIRNLFTTLVHGEEVSKGKPDPEIYLMASDRLKVPPKDCVVFEDSLAGIEAGQRAGMKVVAITSTYPASQLGHADQVINSFEDFRIDQIYE